MTDLQQTPDPQREQAAGRTPAARSVSGYGAPLPTSARPDSRQGPEIVLSEQEKAIAAKHRAHDEHVREQQERLAAEQSVAEIRRQAERERENERQLQAYARSRYPGSDESFTADWPALRADLMRRIVAGEITMQDVARESLQAPDYRPEW